MKPKHLAARIDQCARNAVLSTCSRRQFGALILDPVTNSIVADGYNGPARGEEGGLCGGKVCERDGIESGTRLERGCHHAEQNAMSNASRQGKSMIGAWLIVTGEPCEMCAKRAHHDGIAKVIILRGGYSTDDGVRYLERYGVTVEYVERETTEATPAPK